MNKILFLGDICSHGYTDEDVKAFKRTKLCEFLNNYEGIVVGNLEAPILDSNITVNNNKFSLLNPPRNSVFFDFCNLVTLSNNHIFDQGIEGFNKTKSSLQTLGIDFLGAGADIFESRKPQVVSLAGKKVALLAYNCYSTNSSCNADFSSHGTAPLLMDFIKQDVASLKSGHVGEIDSIILLPHWGIENQFFPTAEQVNFARNVIDLGVDAVIGTHTHTIQTWEKYNDGYIYYSLGNFLFNNFKISADQNYYQNKFNKEGLIVEVAFEEDGIFSKEYFVKLDGNFVPEFCSTEDLKTPVLKNNESLNKIAIDLNRKNATPELSLSLLYNGRSSQIVYTSKPIDKSLRLNYETSLAKFKRLIIYRLRKLLK